MSFRIVTLKSENGANEAVISRSADAALVQSDGIVVVFCLQGYSERQITGVLKGAKPRTAQTFDAITTLVWRGDLARAVEALRKKGRFEIVERANGIGG